MIRIACRHNPIDIVCVHLDPGRYDHHDVIYNQFITLMRDIGSEHVSTIIAGHFNMALNDVNPTQGWKASTLFNTYDSNNYCTKSKYKFAHPFDGSNEFK